MAKDNDIGRILIYQNEKGDTKIDVFFEEDIHLFFNVIK